MTEKIEKNNVICKNPGRIFLIIIPLLFLLLMIFYVFTSFADNFFHILIAYIYLVCLIFLIFLLIFKDQFFIDLRECISISGLKIAVIMAILFFVFLGFIFLFQPPQVIADPAQFEIGIPIGESHMNMTSIENMGNSEINISFENPYPEVKLNASSYRILPGVKKYLYYSASVDKNASPGVYRTAINFTTEQKLIKIIPIIITVLPPAKYQFEIIDPLVLNISEWGKIRLTTINKGESPVYGINIRINESELNSSIFDFSEAGQNYSTDLLEKDDQIVTDWWIRAKINGDPSWHPVHFNVTSKNAGNQTIVTIVKINPE